MFILGACWYVRKHWHHDLMRTVLRVCAEWGEVREILARHATYSICVQYGEGEERERWTENRTERGDTRVWRKDNMYLYTVYKWSCSSSICTYSSIPGQETTLVFFLIGTLFSSAHLFISDIWESLDHIIHIVVVVVMWMIHYCRRKCPQRVGKSLTSLPCISNQ